MSDRVTIRIDKIVVGGQGLGLWDGKAVFVPFVLPGERVAVKVMEDHSSFAKAALLEVLEASPERVDPICPLFGSCGGCQWLHVNYAFQVELKRGIFMETLKRIGRLDGANASVVSADHTLSYRTSCRLHVDEEGRTGYYGPGTREVVPLKGCPLHHPNIDKVVEAAATGLLKGADGLAVRCGDDGTTMASLTASSLKGLPEEMGMLPCDGLFFNGEHIRGVQWVVRCLGDMVFHISPETFFQIHCEMVSRLNSELRRVVANRASGSIVDVYGGTGIMGMSLCDLAEQVVCIELGKRASEDAVEAARLNGVTNFRQLEATAEAGLEILRRQGLSSSMVILDPPRLGCEKKVLQELILLGPETIVYVSCNPATLARDLAILKSAGWTPVDYVILDLFPQTFHIESITVLSSTQRNPRHPR